MWKCLKLPWHKLKTNKIYTNMGGVQVKCSCGKLYAMHADTRSFLAWDSEFERLYKGEPFKRRYDT